MDKVKIEEEREKAKEKATKDYQQIAKKAKRTKNTENMSRHQRLINWF